MGVAMSISACGGDGDDVSLGPPLPPEQALLDITAANAVDVAATVVTSVDITFGIGNVTGDLVAQGEDNSLPPALAPDEAMSAVIVRPLTSTTPGVQSCAISGTAEISGAIGPPITAGNSINAFFDECDDGLGFVLSGAVDISVLLIEGAFLTPRFRLDLDVVLSDIEIRTDNDIATADGAFTLQLDALDWPRVAQGIEGTELVLGANGERIVLSDFSQEIRLTGSIAPVSVIVDAAGDLDSTSLAGAVSYTTPLALRAWDGFDPFAGQILVTGNSGSSVRVVVNDIGSVALEVDERGNGVIDAYIEATWSDLLPDANAGSTAPGASLSN
jgi:hypothetical protein